MTAPEPRYWIDTVSLDHVETAVRGGFTQSNHGANTRLRHMAAGDHMVFYSPRTSLRGGTPVQRFTALGVVTGTESYQAVVSDDFRPWRLDVEYEASTPADRAAAPVRAASPAVRIADVRGLLPVPLPTGCAISLCHPSVA